MAAVELQCRLQKATPEAPGGDQRAGAINAALRSGLPADAEQAAGLVAAHAQRVELAAALKHAKITHSARGWPTSGRTCRRGVAR
jgi:hypothetical protein